LEPRIFEDRLHRVLDGQDEAGGALRLLLEPDVEPDRRIERRHLVEQDVGELGLEGVAVLLGGEVAALAAPIGDRAGHAADHLLDRVLAGGGAHLTAEVLLRDDVGRVLRPRLRELDVLLLEGNLVAVADARIAQLPLDGLEGVDAGLREQSPHGHGLTGAGVLHECRLGGSCHGNLLSSSPGRLHGESRVAGGGRSCSCIRTEPHRQRVLKAQFGAFSP
jgi:hypothetical protein